MTNRLSVALHIYHGDRSHSAAMNMAIDEALLESAAVPSIRFYGWQSPALSFGYFGRFSDVASYARERDLVRRWTGGGIVFHGDDLTYSIVLPSSDPAFLESSMTIYEKIHRALAGALNAIGQKAVVAGAVDTGRALATETRDDNCFANPVRADVMVDGCKVAGAAQRRTRRGLLHQGSIQGVAVTTDFSEGFARRLSANRSQFKITEEILKRARELAQQKYGSDSWLHKR